MASGGSTLGASVGRRQLEDTILQQQAAIQKLAEEAANLQTKQILAGAKVAELEAKRQKAEKQRLKTKQEAEKRLQAEKEKLIAQDKQQKEVVKGFTQPGEKEAFFKSKSPFSIGLIKTKTLDTEVQIFNEVYVFDQKVRDKKGTRVTAAMNNSRIRQNTKIQDAIKQEGFNVSEELVMNPVKEVEDVPVTYNTVTEFEHNYLQWLVTPVRGTDNDDEIRIRSTVLKNLFRFVFGTKKVKDITGFYNQMKVAYSKLDITDKLPCHTTNQQIWEDFRSSLQWRMELAMEELVKLRAGGLPELNQTVEKLKELILGLHALIQRLDLQGGPCFSYTEKEYVSASDFIDEDVLRLLKIFRDFVAAKKSGSQVLTLDELKQQLLTKGEQSPPGSESAQLLYVKLLELLDWTAQQKAEKSSEEFEKLEKENQELDILNITLLQLLQYVNGMWEIKSKIDVLLCKAEACCAKKKRVGQTVEELTQELGLLQQQYERVFEQLPPEARQGPLVRQMEQIRTALAQHEGDQADHRQALAQLMAGIIRLQGLLQREQQQTAGLAGALQAAQAAEQAARAEIARLDAVANLLARRAALAQADAADAAAQVQALQQQPRADPGELAAAQQAAAAAAEAARQADAAAQAATDRAAAAEGRAATAEAERAAALEQARAAAAQVEQREAARAQAQAALEALQGTAGADAAALEAARRDLATANEAVRAARAAQDALAADLEGVRGELARAQEAARAAAEAAGRELAAARQEAANANGALAALREQLAAAAGGASPAEAEALRARIAEAEAEAAAADERATEAEAAAEEVRGQADTAAAAVAEAEALRGRLAAAEAAQRERDAALAALREQLAAATAGSGELAARLEEKEAERAAQAAAAAQLREQLAAATQGAAEAAGLRARLAEIEDQQRARDAALTGLREQLAASAAGRAANGETIAALSARIAELEAAQGAQGDEVAALRQQLRTQAEEAEAAAAAAAEAHAEALEAARTDRAAEVEAAIGQAREAAAALARAQEKGGADEAAIARLQEALTEAGERLTAAQESEREATAALHASQRELGLTQVVARLTITSLKRKIEELKAQIAELQAQKDRLIDAIATMRRSRLQLQGGPQGRGAAQDIAAMDRTIEAVEAELAAVIEELRRKQGDIDGAQARIEAAERSGAEGRAAAAEAGTAVAEAQARAADAEARAAAAAARIAELENFAYNLPLVNVEGLTKRQIADVVRLMRIAINYTGLGRKSLQHFKTLGLGGRQPYDDLIFDEQRALLSTQLFAENVANLQRLLTWFAGQGSELDQEAKRRVQEVIAKFINVKQSPAPRSVALAAEAPRPAGGASGGSSLPAAPVGRAGGGAAAIAGGDPKFANLMDAQRRKSIELGGGVGTGSTAGAFRGVVGSAASAPPGTRTIKQYDINDFKRLLRLVLGDKFRAKAYPGKSTADVLGELDKIVTLIRGVLVAAAPDEPLTRQLLLSTLLANISGTEKGDFNMAAWPMSGGARESQPSEAAELCQTMLLFLLLEASQKKESFDVQEFLDKAGTTLDALGQCPLVLHTLNGLLDEAPQVTEGEMVFKSIPDEEDMLPTQVETLSNAIRTNFDPDELEVLESLAPSLTLVARPHEEFQDLFGNHSYFVGGEGSLNVDGEELDVTPEEREKLVQEGIPLGALLMLYLVCLKDVFSIGEGDHLRSSAAEDVQESGEIPSPESKCQLPIAKPQRLPKSKGKSKTIGKK